VSGATTGSMISGSEANNLNKFLDIQINKKAEAATTNLNTQTTL
jgi:hypothetical protein